jgi:sortase A
MRRAVRRLSSVLIVAGALLVADAALTLAWQEPVSALIASVHQRHLAAELRALDAVAPSAPVRRALAHLRGQPRRRVAVLARAFGRRVHEGAAIGRIRIPRLGASFVLVEGTDPGALREGPGHYPGTPLPGRPGTVAIAGHRTTYLAPFRHIDALRRGDAVVIEMPYGRFTYRVARRRVVAPTDLSVLRRGRRDRLVLSACHPLYSAAQRIVVIARLARVQPRGAPA